MLNFEWFSILAIISGYLLGSIPSTLIVGKVHKNIDMRNEGDGHISATAIYRNCGFIPFLIVLVMDIGKGAAAVMIAAAVTQNQWIILGAGIAAMAGHCWSVFMRFKGGFGATVLYGVLAALALWQLIVCLIVSAIIFLIVRRSTLSTVLVVIFIAPAIYFSKGDIILAIYPFTLLLVQFIKRFSIKNKPGEKQYKNNLFSDFKRVKQ